MTLYGIVLDYKNKPLLPIKPTSVLRNVSISLLLPESKWDMGHGNPTRNPTGIFQNPTWDTRSSVNMYQLTRVRK